MKQKCSMCSKWISSESARKLCPKQTNHPVCKKLKLDENESFACGRCYCNLYKADTVKPVEIAAGPSRTVVDTYHEVVVATTSFHDIVGSSELTADTSRGK